jgi:hypothetical protein
MESRLRRRIIYAKETKAMTCNAKLIRRSILAAFIGVALMSIATSTGNATNAATNASTACPYIAKCPIDGADSNYQYSEFSGMTEIGVYEHSLATGETHRFRMRCN